jgi:hypothetical protein
MRFKNNKITADTWVGMTIQPGEYYTIENNELSKWQTDPKVQYDINTGGGIFNDGFSDITIGAANVGAYLDITITPFIKDLMRNFAASNISLGITQAGKTGHLLGLFTKQYDVNSNGLPISLKDTFDTGSLYESIKIIQHLRDNPTEFDGLSPFVTDEKLHQMKNAIEIKLGVTPT